MILAIAIMFNLELEQLDVKTAFLHEILDDALYISQPEGFARKGGEDKLLSQELLVWVEIIS